MLLFAVHISDGVLQPLWLVGGFVIAGLLAWLGSRRIRDEEIPRIAVMGSAFFVASAIHVPAGASSVHLLFNGLVGIVLGPRAALAIPVGLFLQKVLFAHGGFSTLGINTCVQVLPALVAWLTFARIRDRAWFQQPRWRSLTGLLVGGITVLATIALNALCLTFGGVDDWPPLTAFVVLSHLPLVALEGVVMAATIAFLAKVKPEMIGLGMSQPTPVDPQVRETADRKVG